MTAKPAISYFIESIPSHSLTAGSGRISLEVGPPVLVGNQHLAHRAAPSAASVGTGYQEDITVFILTRFMQFVNDCHVNEIYLLKITKSRCRLLLTGTEAALPACREGCAFLTRERLPGCRYSTRSGCL